MEVLNIFQVIQGKDFNILAIIESLQVSFEGNDNFIWELVENLMSLNPHKLLPTFRTSYCIMIGYKTISIYSFFN